MVHFHITYPYSILLSYLLSYVNGPKIWIEIEIAFEMASKAFYGFSCSESSKLLYNRGGILAVRISSTFFIIKKKKKKELKYFWKYI